MRELVFGKHGSAGEHLITDVTLLTGRRNYVRRLDVAFQLALGLERQRAVDALLAVQLVG